ncbi:MAG TPA: hypothetical protein PKE62_14820 [Anaerolineales bacterium]|nr:hypothetical protein [Anaerolineales bacterium]
MSFQLAACGVAIPAPTAIVEITPTFTPPIPTATLPLPTPALTSTPASSLPVSSAPDGLRMAYIIDGNLYFQNGSHPPVQLTYSGEEQRPLFFSQDGKKIFFYRGIFPQSIYSITTDGMQEQALFTTTLLITFDAGYDETITPCDPALVPHSHFLLFRTCSHPDENTTIRNGDLFIVDTDTNEVKNLLPRGEGGTFFISPDGRMLAIRVQNSINIVGIDGKTIRDKLITYTPSEPIPLAPLVYWISDSKGLIVAVPINTFYDTSQPPTYSIWRYSFDTGEGIQISLNPPPMSHEAMWVSTDGNWITYNNYYEHSFYLGDLRNGSARPYEIALPHEWSLDNVHFIYNVPQPGGSDLYLASVDAPPVFVGKGEFIGWLDSSRYIYFTDQTFILGEIDREPIPILVGNTQSLFSHARFIFAYQLSSK